MMYDLSFTIELTCFDFDFFSLCSISVLLYIQGHFALNYSHVFTEYWWVLMSFYSKFSLCPAGLVNLLVIQFQNRLTCYCNNKEMNSAVIKCLQCMFEGGTGKSCLTSLNYNAVCVFYIKVTSMMTQRWTPVCWFWFYGE